LDSRKSATPERTGPTAQLLQLSATFFSSKTSLKAFAFARYFLTFEGQTPERMASPSRKARVYSLYPLSEAVYTYGSTLFELYQPSTPGWENWRLDADALMTRTEKIYAEDAAPTLKYIAKHGVGIDNIPAKAMNDRGVVIMNTAGVNVCEQHLPEVVFQAHTGHSTKGNTSH
jgi:hypothetical protein